MIKLYLKQAWTLMKQNKLFTSVYVIGTGLSIALTMTMFIIFYIKFAPVYPEYNRNRMLVIKALKGYEKDNPNSSGCNHGVSYYVVSGMLSGLPHLDKIGAGRPNASSDNNVIALPGKKETFQVVPYYADQGFWEVFSFRFLSGRPYTKDDVDANAPVAVLSKSLARRLFTTTEATGKHFMYNGKDFRVCGVVEDVSTATPCTFGDLWIPLFHTSWASKDKNWLLGNIQVYMTALTVADKQALRAEAQEAFQKYELQSESTRAYDLMDQPDTFWKSVFRVDSCNAPDFKEILKGFLYILLALLFIPAMNLSGMISSRMGHRLCELGVRKAYGATNRMLLQQVLWENLFLTCVGGLVGLLLSYLIVVTSSDWILTLFEESIDEPQASPFLTFEMLFNPTVFCSAFGLCVVINIISALLPTIWTLRHTIVQSLNAKR